MDFSGATWGLLIHLLAALWLAGGAFAGAVVRAQMRKAADLRERAVGMRIGLRLLYVLALPGTVLAGLVGLYLVTARGFTFTTPWVRWSIVVYLLMLFNLLALILPRVRKVGRAVAESAAQRKPTADLERLAGAAKLAGILSDVNLLGLVILTLLMTLKPGGATLP